MKSLRFARSLTKLLTLAALAGVSSIVNAAGMVASIDKAPVVPNGDVAGQPTDYVITFEGSPDPIAPGRGLMAGQQIRIILPEAFDLANIDPDYPLLDAPTPFPPAPPLPEHPCFPGNLICTTAVLLQGWPQHPLFPPVLFHTLSIDKASNALVITAAQDIVPNPPVNPGIKQVHLIFNGVTNPKPGNYRVRVEAQTGPGGSWETGSGLLTVRPEPRPSVNPTSVFVPAQLEDTPGCGPSNPPEPGQPVVSAHECRRLRAFHLELSAVG